MRLATIPVALGVLLVPPLAHAQYANPFGVVAGSRVRIVAPTLADQPLVGRLAAAGGDSLVLLASARPVTVRLPRGAVQGVAVSEGSDRVGMALRYGAIGALAGGVLGAATLSRDEPLAGFVGFFAGAVVAAPLGAAVGAIFAPERWRDVSVALPPASGPSGTYRLTMDPGTDVRLAMRSSPERTMKTTVYTVSNDTLLISPRSLDGVRRIPLADLARLEVRGGKDRRLGVLYGAAAFGAITAVAGGIDYAHQNISGGDLLGTMLGNMLLGGVVGYALSPTGWEAIALPHR